jgi:hypothetical protein
VREPSDGGIVTLFFFGVFHSKLSVVSAFSCWHTALWEAPCPVENRQAARFSNVLGRDAWRVDGHYPTRSTFYRRAFPPAPPVRPADLIAMEQAILDACGGTPLEEVESLTLDSKCKSASVVGLEKCVKLEELSANNCGITSLEGFPSLPILTKLELSDNRISGGLAALKNLPSLVELSVAGNAIGSVDELLALEDAPLVVLDLVGCPCSDDSQEYRDKVFGMFPSLQALDGKDKDGEELELGSDDDDDEDEDEEDFDEEESDDDDDDEDEDEDEDDEPIEVSDDDDDDDEEEEEESDDDDDEPGLAALVGAPIDDDAEEEDFQAESDPESEDFDDEEDDDDDAGAAKKQRTE